MMRAPHNCIEGNVEAFAQHKPQLSPKIYYLHPLMIGPPCKWSIHLERCRKMGFDHIATPPLFAPGPAGDLFLAGDLEFAHPILGRARADGADTLGLRGSAKAEDVIGQLARTCRMCGLGLLVDVVLDRVDANGQLARSNP